MNSMDDFEIIDGLLKEYYGTDEEIIIPYGTTTIGYAVFRGRKEIRSVIIPDTVTDIEMYAFSFCTNLTHIEIPESVTFISYEAFSGCEGLKDDREMVVIRNVLYSYYGNESNLIIPEGITRIESAAFSYCKVLEHVHIPKSVTSIGISAFSYCSNLKDIEIPNGVSSIDDATFTHCTNLRKIVLPNQLTHIKESAFSYCESLESIVLPEGLTHIYKNAFYHCENLKELQIPESVTSIGDGAFIGCKQLARPDGFLIIRDTFVDYFGTSLDITIPDSVIRMDSEMFHTIIIYKSIVAPYTIKTKEELAYLAEKVYVKIPVTITLKEIIEDMHIPGIIHQFWIVDSSNQVIAKCPTIQEIENEDTDEECFIQFVFLERSYFTESGIDFEKYDALFGKYPEYELEMALCRLKYPYKLSNLHLKRYVDYLISKDMESYIIDEEMVESLERILTLNMLTRENYQHILEYAAHSKKTNMIAMLLEYGKYSFEEEDFFD